MTSVSQETGDVPARTRRDQLVGMTTLILGALITLLSILWAFQVQSYLGMAFFGEQFLAVVLGCALCLTFLMHRAKRGSDGPARVRPSDRERRAERKVVVLYGSSQISGRLEGIRKRV